MYLPPEKMSLCATDPQTTDEDESRKKCANDFVFAQEARTESKRVAARDKE